MKTDDVVEAYFRHYGEKRDDDRWAWEWVHDLVGRDPDEGWALILALVDKAPSDAALAYVAAGPLEDLLKKHGQVVIDRVDAESRKSNRLQLALSGAWITSSDPVFDRWCKLMSEFGFADGGREAL